MKATALKSIVSILGLFAGLYISLLYSVLNRLVEDRSGEGSEGWSLIGAGFLFGCPALIGCIGLGFIGRLKDILGGGFARATKVLLVLSALTVIAHLAIFVWALWSRTTAFSGR